MAKPKPPADPAALGNIPREWSWFASGPVLGCALVRERCRTVVWDATNVVTALDAAGAPYASFACPQPLAAVAADDVGQSVLVVGRSGRAWWLDHALEPLFVRDRLGLPVAAALDAHGQYAAVAGDHGQTIVFGADNRDCAVIETRQPLRRLLWTAANGYLFGAAEHGIVGLWDVRGREYWTDGLWANVGGVAAAGEGDAFFLACPQQGILRYNLDGKREGAYRIDGFPTVVAADFAGRRLLAATNDKKLVLMTYQGVVETTRSVPDEVVGVQLDALGRFAVWASRAGEVRWCALDDLGKALAVSTHRGAGREAVDPAWEIGLAGSTDETRSALLEPIPGTALLGVSTSNRKVRVFDSAGNVRHESAGVAGVGRSLRGGPGWLLLSTDSNVLAYDAAANRSELADYPIYDTSHAEPFGAAGDVLLVSSCEHVARLRVPDDEVWKLRTEDKIDTVAVQPDGRFAATFDDRRARFYGADGARLGSYRPNAPEPLAVAALADGGWATLGRDSRTLRGHEPDGKLLWSVGLPWAPWGVRPLGAGTLAVSDRGESLLVDAAGAVVAESREPRPDAKYAVDPQGGVVRVYLVENALVAADFAGKVRWRHAAEKPVAAFATDGRSVWAAIGKNLCWFPFGA